MIRHAFTVDVEDWYHGLGEPLEQYRDRKRLDRGINFLLELLAEHQTKGTFFWLGKAAEENPYLLKKVAAAGHEIGCHGWKHEPICDMSPVCFKNDTYHAATLIADLIGAKVIAYRAPYFSITKDSLWALRVLVELGFKYDSSIFPLNKGKYGIPGFSSSIQTVCTASGSIIEIPISIGKRFGKLIPISGGGFFRLYPYQFTRANFRHLEQINCPTIFYIHPWELDSSRPFGKQSLTEYCRNSLGISSTKAKLRRLLRDFYFGTLEDLIDIR